MAHTSTIRRLAAAGTITGFTMLVLSAPAYAKPDWGQPTPTDGAASITREVTVPVDDNSLELLQIGLGTLAGMALAGAGAAAVNTRRNHRQPRAA